MGASIQETQLVTVTSKDGTQVGLWRTGSGSSLLAVHGGGADHAALQAEKARLTEKQAREEK